MRRGSLIVSALIAVTALAAGTSFAAPPGASAEQKAEGAQQADKAKRSGKRFRTRVTISSSVPAFSGRVRSGKPRCERRRRVILFRRGNGSRRHRVGADWSNRRGHWAVPVDNLRSGAYFAKVKRKRMRGKRFRNSVCRSARSRIAVIT